MFAGGAGTGKLVRVSRGQKAFYLSLISPWINYLTMPENVYFNLVVLPFAVLFGFSVRWRLRLEKISMTLT
ncbi:MAG: DUF4400 domain-containing protein [Methylobacter sp.]